MANVYSRHPIILQGVRINHKHIDKPHSHL
nr:MAG TPA: hypothetical protein [Caudoviricetes sp.]